VAGGAKGATGFWHTGPHEGHPPVAVLFSGWQARWSSSELPCNTQVWQRVHKPSAAPSHHQRVHKPSAAPSHHQERANRRASSCQGPRPARGQRSGRGRSGSRPLSGRSRPGVCCPSVWCWADGRGACRLKGVCGACRRGCCLVPQMQGVKLHTIALAIRPLALHSR